MSTLHELLVLLSDNTTGEIGAEDLQAVTTALWGQTSPGLVGRWSCISDGQPWNGTGLLSFSGDNPLTGNLSIQTTDAEGRDRSVLLNEALHSGSLIAMSMINDPDGWILFTVFSDVTTGDPVGVPINVIESGLATPGRSMTDLVGQDLVVVFTP